MTSSLHHHLLHDQINNGTHMEESSEEPAKTCSDPYENFKSTAAWLLQRTTKRPRIAIMYGSGLTELVEILEEKNVFEYKDIPNFPVPIAQGDGSRLVFGRLKGRDIVCMKKRFYFYEGHDMEMIAYPVRLFFLMGVKILIITSTGGGVNLTCTVGDIVIIKDHINMAGITPLRGRNDERFGMRFPRLYNIYDKDLREIAKQAALEQGCDSLLPEGVFCMLPGPAYETVAEARMLQLIEVDVVGMSTVPEVVVANHCGMRVLAFCLIKNMLLLDYNTDENTQIKEALNTCSYRLKDLKNLITNTVSKL